ncbi:MAG: nucleotide sugar dehydrogenase [Deltaproteobacteria bacterium]|nr:nucleotide sugar dehydrogenase [Deltaproteobacteria bacterium]
MIIRPKLENFVAHSEKIAVVGLGYVGLPLAVHLSHHFSVIGFDVKDSRIRELRQGFDQTLEITLEQLKAAALTFTSDPRRLAECRLIIVAVPTPIDGSRIPDLSAIRGASTLAGRHLNPGSCVVYESTVYPGVTEEICVPILASESGLNFGQDFFVGYSPERINPGDKVHTLESIVKIVSGSDQDTVELLKGIYGKIVKAGIYEASSIKVAEAAKVIENTQRDINIALMNELSIIFQRMGIDSLEVLEASGTKWNFLPFRPGLVGGHCIGVDPYYLTYKAESLGYHPEMILAGRRINDGMGKYIAERTVKMLIAADKPVRKARVAVLGLTFKENIPDIRNTRVVDIITELVGYGIEVLVHDPLAIPEEVHEHYHLNLTPLRNITDMDAIIVAVAHDEYLKLGVEKIATLCKTMPPLVIDIKGLFKSRDMRGRDMEKQNIQYWSL